MLRDRIILCLRVLCFLLFAGYAWIGRNGNLPPPIRHGAWHSFENDFLVFLAAICFLPLRFRIPLLVFLSAGSLNLAFISWTSWTSSGRGVGQFLEHATQFFTPMILCLVLRIGEKTGWTAAIDAFSRRGLALSFFFHGLFAYGFTSYSWILHHQTPPHFVEMVQNCLGVEEVTTSAGLLRAIGIADFIVAICVLIPKTRIPALVYMAAWGFLTALARPWAYFDPANAMETLNSWVPEFLIRTPHFLLPLLLLWIWKTTRNAKSAVSTSKAARTPSPKSP